MTKHLLVTGGNQGIGFALCKKLAQDGHKVFLGARSAEKGEAAVKDILSAVPGANVEFVPCDVSSDDSVKAAASMVKEMIDPLKLYAIVNNAGTGLGHGNTSAIVLNTNLYGTKRVCDAFLPLLCPKQGRVVNVGSGGGPGYVGRVGDVEAQKMLCGFGSDLTWEWIDSHAKSALNSSEDTNGGYGLSKALVTCYTMILAREHPNIISSAITPGFIKTRMTANYGATKLPAEGIVSIMHCLFETLDGNGWYYGSDAIRSPLHFMRNPGEPEYDGMNPF